MHELTTPLRKYGYDGTDEQIMVGMGMHKIKRTWRINTRNTFNKTLVMYTRQVFKFFKGIGTMIEAPFVFLMRKAKTTGHCFQFCLKYRK